MQNNMDYAQFEDFVKLDIRVGYVKEAKNLESSNKLIELVVDYGPEYGIKTVLTGMRKWHSPEEFVGKKYLFIANLAPRKMAGSVSNGMIMSADKEGAPVLIEVNENVEAGLRVI